MVWSVIYEVVRPSFVNAFPIVKQLFCFLFLGIFYEITRNILVYFVLFFWIFSLGLVSTSGIIKSKDMDPFFFFF